jgi:hypothetical protein
MDALRTVPVAAPRSEAHFGTQAHEAAHAQPDSDLPGVDLPGVGHMPVYETQQPPPTVAPAARSYTPGEVPEPLRGVLVTERQDELLSLLIVQARKLALSRLSLLKLDVADRGDGQLWSCIECKRSAWRETPIIHRRGCPVGKMVGILDDLFEAAADRVPTTSLGKETAPAGLQAADAAEEGADGTASDSISDYGEPWQYRVDTVLQVTNIYDREGTLIASLNKSDREAMEWAARIVDCVNQCAFVDYSKVVRS